MIDLGDKMSSLEQEERENFNKLRKLVFQVGLPSIRELFVKRYSQKYGNWEETPEFGEKLLKMLDDQNNGKGVEILKKYEERENIKSGKVSEWDYTTLQFILSNLDFGNSSSSSNGFVAENKMVQMLTEVGNNLVHDYSKEEKIHTDEFVGTLDEIFDACFDLGAGKEVMDNIMKLYQNQNNSGQNSVSSQLQMSTSEGVGGHQHVYSSFSSPPSTTNNANISTAAASLNNSVAFEMEDKNKFVVSSSSLSKPMISSIYLDPEHVKATATISPAIASSKIATAPTNYVQPSTFLSPSANSASTTATSSNANNEQFGAPGISSPAKFNAQNKSSKKPLSPPAQTSNSGAVNTTNNPATQKEDVSCIMHTMLFMFLHGIFLLVISSVFLSRLVHFSEYFPNIDWMMLTIIAVCLGALRIVLPLSCFLLMLLNDPKARSSFWNTFGFFYLASVFTFGLLVILFMTTNCYNATFFNCRSVEGIKNNNLYVWLIMALSVEPALLCIFTVLFFVVGVIYAIVVEAKKCLCAS